MNLKKLLFINNNCYKAGKEMTPKGIMVHSTGANNPKLSRYIGPNENNWNVPKPGGRNVCVHGFIGKLEDGSIATYQTLPWNMKGWHAGGSANDSYIGFEICEDGLKDKEYFDAVYKEAVELCIYLCEKYDLTEKNIICHCEGFKKGIASNHGDVMHWFPKHGKSMDTFRVDVAEGLSHKSVEKVHDSGEKSLKTGKVTADVLNIRTGPGANYKDVGDLKRGDKVEIHESKNGWYRIGERTWVSSKYISTKE